MAHQPDNQRRERDYQHEKNDAAFPPFLPQRFPAATAPPRVAPSSVLERDRNIETAPAFGRARQQFFPVPARGFFRHFGSFRDHPLELFHLAAELRLFLSQFFLFLIQRRPGLRRSAAHAVLLGLRRHPEENDERDDPENDEGQTDGQPNLHPLSKRFPGEPGRARPDFR